MTKELIEKLKQNEMASIYEDSVYITLENFSLFLGANQHNDLMKLSIEGERSLTKIKSLKELLKEYSENSESELKNYYYKLMNKYGKELEKLSKKFNDDINNVLKNLEKDLKKL